MKYMLAAIECARLWLRAEAEAHPACQRAGDHLGTGGPPERQLLKEQGSQCASDQFQRLMAAHGIICSMSCAGNVWDNAAMESFFSAMKIERTERQTYRTRDQAKADVFGYIERFYNPGRRHSARLSQPDGVRKEGAVSSGWCPPTRQQFRTLE